MFLLYIYIQKKNLDYIFVIKNMMNQGIVSSIMRLQKEKICVS